MTGFQHRVAKLVGPAEIEPAKLAFLEAYVENWLEKWYDGPKFEQVTDGSFEAWLQSRPYSLGRKDELRRVWDRVRCLGAVKLKKNKTFIKREFYSDFKPPRLINSRTDEFKVWAGPALQPLNDWWAAGRWSVKHTPIADRPKVIEDELKWWGKCVTTDYSRYESSMRSEIIRVVEAQLYRKFGLPEEMISVFSAMNHCSNKTIGVQGCAFKGWVPGTRMSGDMITSLGNGFTNYMVMKAVCAYHGYRCEGFVEGDDGIFGVEGILDPRWFVEFGFQIELIEHRDIGVAGFCSMNWAQGTLMLDPVRMFRLGWSCRCPVAMGPEKTAELFAGIVTCLAYEGGSSPLFWAVVSKYSSKKLMRLENDWWNRYVLEAQSVEYTVDGSWLYLQQDSIFVPSRPSYEVRVAYEDAFGISVEDQIKIESEILSGEFPSTLERWVSIAHPALVHNATFYVRRDDRVRL